MQWALRTAIGSVDRQRLPPAAPRAEVRHCRVEPDQPQQALNEPAWPWLLGSWAFSWLDLAECHAGKHFHRQAGLDRRIAVVGLPTTFAGRRGRLGHRRVEPDCERAAPLERFVAGQPVPGPAGRGSWFAHAARLPTSARKMNPFTAFAQQNPSRRHTVVCHSEIATKARRQPNRQRTISF